MTATAGTGIARERALRRLREMVRIRRFEERCVELYSAAEIRGFLHLYIGEEAVAVGVFDALSGDDNVVSTYRDHGHALARGVPMVSLAAEMLGKVSGCRRGRGGSMHLFDVGRRFFGGNAITDTLSGDHRVTSGHEGSLFLEALVAALGEEEL